MGVQVNGDQFFKRYDAGVEMEDNGFAEPGGFFNGSDPSLSDLVNTLQREKDRFGTPVAAPAKSDFADFHVTWYFLRPDLSRLKPGDRPE